MKRVICSMLVILLVLPLVCSAMAAEGFTPSVSYKDHPEIKEIKDESGKPAVGLIAGNGGSVVGYVYGDCLLTTPISEASKTGSMLEKVDDEAHQLLLDVYKQLKSGAMKIPYADFDLDPNRTEIRDLFDITWLCVDEADLTDHPEQKNHKEILASEGVTFEVTLDLGVGPKDKIAVFTYKNDKWNHVEKVTNNGDGTVTCVFENLCPVAVCIENPAA